MMLFFYLQMKTGPFAEHSNTLWSITNVPNWTKVNTGLIKMYKKEVGFCFIEPLPFMDDIVMESHVTQIYTWF